MRKKPFRIFFILLSNALILLAGILIIEYFFGNWRGTRGLQRLNVPDNVVLHTNISDIQSSKFKIITYKRDSRGLRGPFTDVAKIELLTLGGSTTDQTGLSEGETWQDILAADFHKDGKEVQIANAGINGQTVLAHTRSLIIWLRFIPGLKPRYISAYVGINDICQDPDVYEHYLQSESSWDSLIRKESALYYLFRTIRGAFLVARKPPLNLPEPNSVSLTHEPFLKNYEGLFDHQLAAYEERLRRLIEEIRAFGATPVLITQTVYRTKNAEGKILGDATPFKCWGKTVNSVDSYHILNLLNERTLKTCREENGICFDLAHELPFEEEDFYDTEHNSWKGAEKIGHYLHGKMAGLF